MPNEFITAPIVFVSCRWAPKYQKINNYIKKLIIKAGMIVSKKMDKTGTMPTPLKESINIMDSHAFCLIISPDSRGILSDEQLHEISTARIYKIPAFIFIDFVETGRPEIQGKLTAHQRDLNCKGDYFEYRKKDLLNGKQDKEAIEHLKDKKTFIQVAYPKIENNLLAAMAVQWGVLSELEPFHTGIKRIADAYAQNPEILYNAAAETAARITGAEFGYVAIREPTANTGEVKLEIQGFHSNKHDKENIKESLEKMKLGFSYSGETWGITGYVLKSGNPFLYGYLHRDKTKLKKAGKNYVDPFNLKIESILAIPITIRGRTIGVVAVEDRLGNLFKTIHQKILQWLAEVFAIAFVGKQLELLIGELSESASRGDNLYDNILTTLSKWSQADVGFIALKNKIGKCKVRAIAGVIKNNETKKLWEKKSLYINPKIGLAGKVLSTGVPIYSENPEKESNYANWFGNIVAEIVLPIKSSVEPNSKTIGIVDLEFFIPQDFKDIDKKLFANLANVLTLTLKES